MQELGKHSTNSFNRTNININDVLGDYGVTLIDTLDTLAIMGEQKEFEGAIKLVAHNVSFDQNSRVQVFETNIRTLGGLVRLLDYRRADDSYISIDVPL